MADNRVDATLTSQDAQEITDAIKTIRTRLPFLMDLSPDERRSMPALGDRSRAFVSRALEVAKQNPGFLPHAFDVDAMDRDMQLFSALQPILTALTQLSELVDDTVHAIGSEAYVDALARHGIALDMDLVKPAAYEQGGGEGIRYLLDDRGLQPGTGVEAVVAYNDADALSALAMTIF